MAFYTEEEQAKYFGHFPILDRMLFLGPVKGSKVAYNRINKKLDILFNRTNLLFQPTSIQLEPTTKCNLRCAFCINPVWDRRGMDMSFEEFKKIIDQFPYLVDVLVQGMGEPLLCKDFFKMADYCRKKRIMVATTTNATLIGDEIAKKIVDSGIAWVMISLDAASKEKFEKIRVGADYDKVLENIRRLVKARGNKATPRLIVSYTGSTENIDELPALVRLSKELGFDGIDVWGVHFWADDTLREKQQDKTLSHDLEGAKKIVDESRAIAEEVGITFSVLGTGSRKDSSNQSKFGLHADTTLCRKIFKSCFVTVDGYVTTCADAPNPDKMNFGNLLREDFDKIWNGPKYMAMRKARLRGIIPEQCKACTGPHIVK